MYKKLSASGGLRPVTPPPEPLDPAGGSAPTLGEPPDPRLGSRRSPWSPLANPGSATGGKLLLNVYADRVCIVCIA